MNCTINKQTKTAIIYKHKENNQYFRLVTERIPSLVNTYMLVDENNVPIIGKMPLSNTPTEQLRIIKGYNNLIKL